MKDWLEQVWLEFQRGAAILASAALFGASILISWTSVRVSAAVPMSLLVADYDELEGLALLERLAEDQKWSALLEAARLQRGTHPLDSAVEAFSLWGLAEIMLAQKDADVEAVDQKMSLAQEGARKNSRENPGVSRVEEAIRVRRAEILLKHGRPCAEVTGPYESSQVMKESRYWVVSRCAQAHENPVRGYLTLYRALKRFSSADWSREQVEWLWQRGLREQAWDAAMQAASSFELNGAEWISWSSIWQNDRSALSRQSQWLELMLAMHPYDPTVLRAGLAFAWERGQMVTLRWRLDRMSAIDSTYFNYIGEILRPRGSSSQAMWASMWVEDPVKRLRLKAAGAIDRGHWPELASMAREFRESHLKSDPELAYALGYSLQFVFQRDQAKKIFEVIPDGPWSRKAEKLLHSERL